MNAGLFNMLHDAANHHVGAVANGINVDFDGGIQEMVQQYRAVIGNQHRVAHITHQLGFVVDDFHRATTQYIGRAHHQRVTDFTGRQNTFLVTANGGVLGLIQAKALNHLLKTLTIFGTVDGIRAGTNDWHTGRLQAARQFQRGLTTVLHDHTLGLLDVDDFQHVFKGDRLKVQPVGGVVIGRYGLRVAVDHDGFIAVFAHGQSGVNTAVIKLDTLTDTVRTATDHHNLLAITRGRFALFFIG